MMTIRIGPWFVTLEEGRKGMQRGKSVLRWTGVVVALAVALLGVEAWGTSGAPAAPDKARADIVTIDAMKASGKLELAPVTFLHDKHTDELAKAGKDCKACHKEDENKRLSLKYMRLKDGSRDEVKEIYHANCFACHKELKAKGAKSGPVDGECRRCHDAKPQVQNIWKPVVLDRSLHARHAGSKEIKPTDAKYQDNCGRCHHEYDEKAKKTFYAEGKEGNCRYCHLSPAETPVVKPGDKVEKTVPRAIDAASHAACVSCHLSLAAEKKDTGPVKCAGCHAPDMQAKFKVLKEIPRMKRKGMPDVALLAAPYLAPLKEPIKDGKVQAVNPVAFNHKLHETVSDTCIACHHGALESCAKRCHTLSGSKDGKFVLLDQAMHQEKSMRSCIGCHKAKQADPKCAGCHQVMPQRANEASCAKCHAKPMPDEAKGQELSLEQKQAIATKMVEAREPSKAVALEDIPEKVVIKGVADQYENAEFPHRKIVLKLTEGMKDNKMVGVFHDPLSLCQGCHHMSPPSKTPPRCASCHGKPFNPETPNRPGVKAAFHQQCMGCHQKMKLQKPADTACAECHKEKKK
jgi:hypothetical protein